MLEKVKDAPRDLVNFYGEVRTELKKVTWPTRKEVYATTAVVLACVFFFGVYLAAVDEVLSRVVRSILNFFG